MVYLGLFVLGLCLGSFINALVWRLHSQWSERYDEDGAPRKLTPARKERLTELSITKGRSMCMHCGHKLGARDLIPVLSWVFLRGRCRYCKKSYDDTPLAELLVPALLVISYIWWPDPLGITDTIEIVQYGLWTLIVTALVALFIYDARWYLLPDKIVWPLTGLTSGFVVLEAIQVGSVWALLGPVLGAAVVSGLFWVLHAISKGTWIGGGDVKLGLSLGLLAGGPLLACLLIFLASLLAMIVMLPGMIKQNIGFGSRIPFGPFLILAGFTVFLWGQNLLDGYIRLLFGS